MKRAATALALALAVGGPLAACSSGDDTSAPAGATTTVVDEAVTGIIGSDDPRSREIIDVVEAAVSELKLQSVVFGVWDGDQEIVRGAVDAPSVQPPTAVDAKVRVGQPMEAMLGTLLLQLGSEGVIDLDAPVARYLPDLVNGDRITPRMLANSTGGTPDYVPDPDFQARVDGQPVRRLHVRRAARLRPADPAAVRARARSAPTPTPRSPRWSRCWRRRRVSRSRSSWRPASSGRWG